jgi:guanylate kinase
VAEEELQARGEFGHVVVNDRLEDALDELTAIVKAELERDRGEPELGAAPTTLEPPPGKAAHL